MEKSNEAAATPTVNDESETSWAELLGSNNWKGLLQPLDLSLRRFILRSGDFCQCTYDSFNDNHNSRYYGSCRYSKDSFFHKVKFEAADQYQVSSFLYATSTLDIGLTLARKTNFIGYIATTTDAASKSLGRREIHVVWRGTKTKLEWFDVANFDPVSAADLVQDPLPPPRVMDGWFMLYTSVNPEADSDIRKQSARVQLHSKLKQLLQEYRDENVSIVVSGHSLGAALAVLSAFDIAENVVTESILVAAIVFGCPQVGDDGFAARLEKLPNLKILHTKNALDPIPLYPAIIDRSYRDAGIDLVVDCRKSPFLRTIPKDLMDWHNLQGILHVVAGWNGADKMFELKVKRSIALVNKSCGFLKDESIPSSWWVVENEGMVLNEHGDWVLAPPPDDFPELF